MTIKPDVIAALVQAGISVEQLAAAVVADVQADDRAREQKRAERRVKDAERQRKHREHARASRESRVTDCDSALRDVTDRDATPEVLPPLASPPTPTPENHPLSPAYEAPRVFRAVTDLEFPGFWHAYPHKTKRASAMTAYYHARQKASVAEIEEGARRYAETLRGPDPPAPMNPDNWLDAERWTDQPMEITRNARQPTSRPAKPASTAADYFATVLPGFGGGAGGADDIPSGGAGWGDGVRGDSVVVEGAEFGFSRRAAGG